MSRSKLAVPDSDCYDIALFSKSDIISTIIYMKFIESTFKVSGEWDSHALWTPIHNGLSDGIVGTRDLAEHIGGLTQGRGNQQIKVTTTEVRLVGPVIIQGHTIKGSQDFGKDIWSGELIKESKFITVGTTPRT